MKKLMICLALGAASTLGMAQEKLEVRPTGRILMDAGMFDNKIMTDGIAIPDVRLGVKASYGMYKAKIDVGFANGKVKLKDIMVERKMGKHDLLRVGYFVHQFGLQSATSSSMKVTMEEPASNQLFFNDRLPGAMWVHSQDKFFGTLSFHAENKAMMLSSDQMGGKQGIGAMSRLVYRPIHNDNWVFQVGISGAVERPRLDEKEGTHSSYHFKCNYPSRISKVKALDANVTDAKNLYKFTPELCVAYGRIGLESQYYYVNIQREKGLNNYHASGAYGILRGVLIGGNYQYSAGGCGLETPRPKTLELVLGYNYTDLNDAKAKIYGGIQNDVSLTMNYYLNKYMIWRVRYSYTTVKSNPMAEVTKVNGLQTRFQILF